MKEFKTQCNISRKYIQFETQEIQIAAQIVITIPPRIAMNQHKTNISLF